MESHQQGQYPCHNPPDTAAAAVLDGQLLIDLREGLRDVGGLGGESMLIDGGDDSWEAAVRHDLEARNLTAFRYFLNTHSHNDHIEGLLYSGEGEIVLETDGTDWYVFQKEKTGRDR